MPSYPWLFESQLDISKTASIIKTMQKLGVPYEEGYDLKASYDMMKQAARIKESLKKDKIVVNEKDEIVALIAYLQRLGSDIEKTNQ
jgi:cytochrome c oxidase cbb3-type subunit I/II